MHYTGTIWRPPYEASSLLLEVTAGCSHHRCKFCTLYADLPFPFRMSPLTDIEADLREARETYRHFSGRKINRVFLTGANPFVLSYERLKEISGMILRYLPEIKTIGGFARVTDVAAKTDEELADLHRAGIRYSFFYLTGISGAGRGEAGAKATAAVCNQLHPTVVGANMLTVYPDSGLYEEIKRGNWKEESETEKYREIRTLVENLNISTVFAALGASNAFQMWSELPKDKEKLLAFLDNVIENAGEEELRRYRKSVRHL